MKLRYTTLLAFALALPALQAQCSTYDFDYSWRLSITVTDSSLMPIGSTSIDTVVDNAGMRAIVYKSGESLAGVTDSAVVDISSSTFGAFSQGACTFAVKTFSLLAMNGAAFGSRITRYTLVLDPNTGNLSGKVQYESRDLSGAIVNVANGTLTGSQTGRIIDVGSDPYWSALKSQ